MSDAIPGPPLPDLEALRLPRDEGGPVFAAPWQARAFALAVALSRAGCFTWSEWTRAFGAAIRAAGADAGPDRYYELWLATVEELVAKHGLAAPAELAAVRAALAAAPPGGHPPHAHDDPGSR